ncbi:MAG TPA: GDSL-type esterase/lipase family protein [Chloroflexia bacterium]|nr:GDSL-type esterase/lipase family protein [Chloroflexia bacterium]
MNTQNPVMGLLFGGLAVMGVVVVLSAVAWAWAVRRPAAEAEAPAIPTPAPRPITYAAIGASDVEGAGADDPATESWINVLHEKMPEGTKLVRLGRGGITLGEANRVEVPAAAAADPDIITMWNVVNDATHGITLTTYVNDLTAALDKLTKETRATIVLLNMPDITIVMRGLPGDQVDLIRGGVEQWNRAIAEAAARYGDRVHVVDMYPISEEVLDHPEYISNDNFHPSSTGYRRLAELVWAEIERAGLLER